MKRITLCKASPITRNEPVEDVEIHIKDELPDYRDKASREIEKFYRQEALNLSDVLNKHLPQGTRHQLLILLLQDVENLYRGI